MENTGSEQDSNILLRNIKVIENIQEPEIRRSVPIGAEWVGNSERRDSLDIYVNSQVLQAAMEDGRRRGPHIEAGGVFAGRRYIDNASNRPVTELTDYIPLEMITGSISRITFTPDAWRFAQSELD